MSKQPNQPTPERQPSPADRALLEAIARLPAADGPPKALDEAILAASRQALKRQPLARMRPWLSLAAAVFVVFFATNLIQQESARQSAESERISVPAAVQSEPDAVTAETQDASAGSAAEETRPMAPAAPTPSEIPVRAKINDQPAPADAEAALRSSAAPEPQPAPASKPAKRAPAAAPETAIPRPRAFPADDAPVPTRPAAPPAPPTLAPAPEPAPAPASGLVPSPAPARERADRRSTADAIGAASAAGASAGHDKAASVSLDAADSRPGARAVAERWFERIREQLRNGEPERAKALLSQFRSRFPDTPLPADLRTLEEAPR